MRALTYGSGFDEIGRWFRELQHYGFIVMTKLGCLGLDGKGKSPHWRLTEGRVPWRGVAEVPITTFAGIGRIGQLAIAGKLTAGSSPIGAIVSSVM